MASKRTCLINNFCHLLRIKYLSRYILYYCTVYTEIPYCFDDVKMSLAFRTSIKFNASTHASPHYRPNSTSGTNLPHVCVQVLKCHSNVLDFQRFESCRKKRPTKIVRIYCRARYNYFFIVSKVNHTTCSSLPH